MNKKYLVESISDSPTIEEAKEKFLLTLAEIKQKDSNVKICYVIGIINSDGPEHIIENLKLLNERSAKVSDNFDGIVFSAADIFNQVLFERFDGAGAKNQDYLNFWEEVIKSGFITDIVRTPRWEKSSGASFENKISLELGLAVHDYDDLVGQI